MLKHSISHLSNSYPVCGKTDCGRMFQSSDWKILKSIKFKADIHVLTTLNYIGNNEQRKGSECLNNIEICGFFPSPLTEHAGEIWNTNNKQKMSCMSYMSNMSYMTYLTCMVLLHTTYYILVWWHTLVYK